MAYDVTWAVDAPKVLHYRFSPDWTPRDIVDSIDTGQELIEQTEHPYSILLDFGGTKGSTSGIVSLYPEISRRIKDYGIDAVAIGLVARRPTEVRFANSLLGIFKHMYNQDIRAFDTAEAALIYLSQQITA